MQWSVEKNWRGDCVWNELGSPPRADEIEITVMGPGYGESVVIHLGNGQWMIVDSCVDSFDPDKPSAPLKYLSRIGVKFEKAVKFIVVTHWDDDHVRGMADVVESCSSADFFTTDVFTNEKFISFVQAMAADRGHANGGNVENIRRIINYLYDAQKTIKIAGPARLINQNPKIFSWSPSDFDKSEFLKSIMRMHPKAGESICTAVTGDSNLASIVLTIEWSDVSVLLGADMEHSPDNRRGWGAVVSEYIKANVMLGDLVKIPHHGSVTGHDDRMWDQMLSANPISIITPFTKRPISSRPPTTNDIKRISGKSRNLYVTARNEKIKSIRKGWAVERTLRDGMISLSNQKKQLGIVRHRRIPNDHWKSEYFGAAYKAK